MLITSYVKNEIRIINVGCSHTFTNSTDFELLVCCVALPTTNENKNVPNNLAFNSFRVPAKITKK